MDARRASRMVRDPIVRHVGFFTPAAPPPDGTQPNPLSPPSPPISNMSPASNSLSPVMILLPRHASDNLSSLPVAVPVPASPRRRISAGESVAVGSYNPSESLLGTSPLSSNAGDRGEFSEESSGWLQRSGSSGGFDLTAPNLENPTPVSIVKKPNGTSGNEKSKDAPTEVQNQLPSSSKPSKEKTTKAERRALQESQRAAKAAAKAEGNKSAAVFGEVAPVKPVKQSSQKKDATQHTSAMAASDKKGTDRPADKDKKKEVPQPRMQFDDKNRVEKAKKRSVVKKTETRNRVELFRHLPQYELGTQLPDLESKFFLLGFVHPAVHRVRCSGSESIAISSFEHGSSCKHGSSNFNDQVGLKYLAGDIVGGNARCVAMLQAFQEAIKDYSTPPEKTLVRDLTAKISSYISFLIECRPLSISMGNAIRVLKNRIAKLPLNLSESEAKADLCADIDRFINEKIILADKVIVRHAYTKIRDGDVLLTYGSSYVVEMILLYAHELGKQFRVVIVDSRPKLEGQALLRRLVTKGLTCTYTHINAVSYIMHEVTRVFLGAASVLSNGTVYSRVGTASVAMVAHTSRVPVLICCEAYKFHERVQLDSICSNELGDPDVISKVPERLDLNYLANWADKENLQLLNLIYDATPSDYVSMIITDYGMVPPTSVPVIVREYLREHLWT